MKIQINNQDMTFTNRDFPILISGKDGTGSSLFTIHVIRDLVESGKKILFFTAFPAAKEDFKNLLSEEELKETEFVEEGGQIEGKRIIVLMSGKEESFVDVLQQISDADERVLLVKNMDQFSQKLFDLIKEKTNLIMSGDLDETIYVDDLKNIDFGARIFFSNPQKLLVDDFPEIEKYKGLMIGKNGRGVIGLKD